MSVPAYLRIGTDRGMWLPLTQVTGKGKHPKLLITAGIHGCEISGIEAALRLPSLISPASLKGTLVVIAPVNVQAFTRQIPRVSPQDGQDLNRLFPGNRCGSFSSVLAAHLFDFVCSWCDFLVDLHGGDVGEKVAPMTLVHTGVDERVREATMAMALAFAADFIVETGSTSIGWDDTGTLYATATCAGIPAIAAEAGCLGRIDPVAARRHIEGVLRVMTRIGMLEAAPGTSVSPRILRGTVHITSPGAGTCRSLLPAGAPVHKQQTLGHFVSSGQGGSTEIRAPVSGVLLFSRNGKGIKESDTLFTIGFR